MSKSPPVAAIVRESEWLWRIPRTGAMRVPGIVFASDALMPEIRSDKSLEQVANVATLPGIVEASYAMPDIHWGYGFPIGGVAATDVANGGVISPGGVGFDISCGVRLLLSNHEIDSIASRLDELMDELGRRIPRGLGKGAVWKLASREQLDRLMSEGSEYAIEEGFGEPGDLERTEDGGRLDGADPAKVGERARGRGFLQVGSLGSGNHFLEVQVVEDVFDARKAEAFDLRQGQVCVMIHCGSRGLGHQICQDSVKQMLGAMPRHGISVPDKQLACAPVESTEGRNYLAAMAAAANYGRANRQLLTHATREAFASVLGDRSLSLLYDVSHNLAKIETHVVDGSERRVCVHRKGATLALPAGDPRLPADLRPHGQPVLIPGSMGTASYVLSGGEVGGAFHSTCHGAGRVMSRAEAKRKVRGSQLRADLESEGIRVRSDSDRGLAEEAPFSYKDVDEVVLTCEKAGLAKRVARLRPVGVVKG